MHWAEQALRDGEKSHRYPKNVSSVYPIIESLVCNECSDEGPHRAHMPARWARSEKIVLKMGPNPVPAPQILPLSVIGSLHSDFSYSSRIITHSCSSPFLSQATQVHHPKMTRCNRFLTGVPKHLKHPNCSFLASNILLRLLTCSLGSATSSCSPLKDPDLWPQMYVEKEVAAPQE